MIRANVKLFGDNGFRNRIFYGQKVKTFLQRRGETLYMPNLILHSVWNVASTISLGNNPLYQSSFVEHLGSGGSGNGEITKTLMSKIKSLQTPITADISEQINAGIRSRNILNFSSPKIWTGYDSLCKKFLT